MWSAFAVLARRYPHHGGILLAAQRRWTVAGLIAALHRVLQETQEAVHSDVGQGT